VLLTRLDPHKLTFLVWIHTRQLFWFWFGSTQANFLGIHARQLFWFGSTQACFGSTQDIISRSPPYHISPSHTPTTTQHHAHTHEREVQSNRTTYNTRISPPSPSHITSHTNHHPPTVSHGTKVEVASTHITKLKVKSESLASVRNPLRLLLRSRRVCGRSRRVSSRASRAGVARGSTHMYSSAGWSGYTPPHGTIHHASAPVGSVAVAAAARQAVIQPSSEGSSSSAWRHALRSSL